MLSYPVFWPDCSIKTEVKLENGSPASTPPSLHIAPSGSRICRPPVSASNNFPSNERSKSVTTPSVIPPYQFHDQSSLSVKRDPWTVQWGIDPIKSTHYGKWIPDFIQFMKFRWNIETKITGKDCAIAILSFESFYICNIDILSWVTFTFYAI